MFLYIKLTKIIKLKKKTDFKKLKILKKKF